MMKVNVSSQSCLFVKLSPCFGFFSHRKIQVYTNTPLSNQAGTFSVLRSEVKPNKETSPAAMTRPVDG